MPSTEPRQPLTEFLADRAGWLRFIVTETPNGGWDVALRVDGVYTERAGAQAIAEFFANQTGLPVRLNVVKAPEPS